MLFFGKINAALSLFARYKMHFDVNRLWLKALVIVYIAICSPYTRMAIFFTLFFIWPYSLLLRFKQAEFVREGEMFTNSSVISWNIKTSEKCMLTVGLL